MFDVDAAVSKPLPDRRGQLARLRLQHTFFRERGVRLLKADDFFVMKNPVTTM